MNHTILFNKIGYVAAADINVRLADISLSGRILASFPERLTPGDVSVFWLLLVTRRECCVQSAENTCTLMLVNVL